MKNNAIKDAINAYRESVKAVGDAMSASIAPDPKVKKDIKKSMMKNFMPGVYPAAKPGSGLHEAGRAIDTNYRRLSAKQQKRLDQIFKAAGLQKVTDPNEIHHFQEDVTGGLSKRPEAVEKSREDFTTQKFFRIWEVKNPEAKE